MMNNEWRSNDNDDNKVIIIINEDYHDEAYMVRAVMILMTDTINDDYNHGDDDNLYHNLYIVHITYWSSYWSYWIELFPLHMAYEPYEHMICMYN